MKMTIVLDSDDREGINDALKMVRIMHKKYSGNVTYHKEEFGKIEFIKLLRKYMRESIEHMKNDDSGQVKDLDDMANLRNAKRFADRIFTGERGAYLNTMRSTHLFGGASVYTVSFT